MAIQRPTKTRDKKDGRDTSSKGFFGLGGVRINPASLNREATYVTEVDNSVVSKRYNIHFVLPSRQLVETNCIRFFKQVQFGNNGNKSLRL